MASTVSALSKVFDLSPAQQNSLRLMLRDKAKQALADSLHKTAIAKPTALGDCKAQLLAMIGSAPVIPQVPNVAPPVPPAPPAPPAPPRAIAWVLVNGAPVAYVPGMAIAPGSLVCYVGDEQSSEPWKPFGPSAPQVPTVPTVQVETRVATDPASIPKSTANPLYCLPWVVSANVGTGGKMYAVFGYQRGKEFQRASIQLCELLEVLSSPAHVADLVRTLQAFKARLGG